MLIYLTGGKTLGHINPLINIYLHYKDKHDFIYLGLNDSLEEKICKNLNIRFIGIDLKGFNRKNMLKNIEVFSLIHKSKKIIKKLTKPDLIISSSGFVCIPILFYSKKTPIFLLEQNTTLGLVNKLFYNKCKKLFLSLPIDKKLDKAVLSGNFIKVNECNYDNILFYKKDKPKILMFFGSMGSESLYKFFSENEYLNSFNVFIVIPNKFYDKYDFKKYTKLKPINNINALFNRFDIVITRAGATTIYEILTSNTKALLIPSPNVTNNHQFKNAVLMKENKLMDYILEDDLHKIDVYLNEIDKYNKLELRLKFIKKDPFEILDNFILNL